MLTVTSYRGSYINKPTTHHLLTVVGGHQGWPIRSQGGAVPPPLALPPTARRNQNMSVMKRWSDGVNLRGSDDSLQSKSFQPSWTCINRPASVSGVLMYLLLFHLQNPTQCYSAHCSLCQVWFTQRQTRCEVILRHFTTNSSISRQFDEYGDNTVYCDISAHSNRLIQPHLYWHHLIVHSSITLVWLHKIKQWNVSLLLHCYTVTGECFSSHRCSDATMTFRLIII